MQIAVFGWVRSYGAPEVSKLRVDGTPFAVLSCSSIPRLPQIWHFEPKAFRPPPVRLWSGREGIFPAMFASFAIARN